MGKGAAKQAQSTLTGAANSATGISNNVNSTTFPALKAATDYNSAIVGGDPAKLAAVVAPQLNQSRSVYTTAQDQIRRMLPAGGSRNQAFTDLEAQHAGDVSRILTGGTRDAVNNLASLGTGGAQISLSGLNTASSAGNSLANMAAAKAQAVGSGVGGIGSGVGLAIGSKAG